MKKRSVIRTISLIISVIALVGIIVVLQIGRFNDNSDQTSKAGVKTAENQAEQTEPIDTLFFASDYQYENGWDTPAETLDLILKKASEDGKIISNAFFCGDYTNDMNLHDYQLSPDDSIAEIKEIVSADCSEISQGDLVFVQGNHDKMTDSISQSGLKEYDNYLVYVLNTEDDFPWKQGRDTAFRDRVTNAAEDMRDCLEKLSKAGEARPVFIAGHVPLHFTARTSSRHTTGDNMYAEYIFDVVNEAAESLDIVYLVGHNHSKGWDCYMGGSCFFKRPGDTVLIPEAGTNTTSTDSYTTEILNFTYMNAGYLGYYMNCEHDALENGTFEQYHAADETLTGTICEIMPGELVFSRYSTEGIHPLNGEGSGDPYMNNIDSGLIGEESYGKSIDSPVRIPRKIKGN